MSLNLLNLEQQELISAYFENNISDISVSKIAQDAGFRKYFRIKNKSKTIILMDCGQESDACSINFIKLARYLKKLKINVPEIFKISKDNKLLLIEDLGNKTIKNILTTQNLDNKIPKYIVTLDGVY